MVRRKIFRRMPLQDVGTRKCSICISLTSVRNHRSGSYAMYYNTKKQQLQMMQKYGMIIHKRVEHTTAGRLDRPEESPGFTEAWQLLTAAGGDPRDSATEIDRRPQQAVRMERRGKSSPAGRVTVPSCKPHPVQDWNGSACAFAQKWLPVRLLIIARVRRQRRAKIDGRTPMHIGRQNPAYCLLICFLLGMLSASPLSLSTDGNIMGISKIIMRR